MEKEDQPKVSKGKTDKEEIIINPPEKDVRPVEEKFSVAVRRHLIDEKTRIVLEAKSALFGIPMSVIEQVFIRGIISESPSHLTKQQHSVNRVNSFISFGEAFLADQDLVPLDEAGMKGTGGAARPHIRVETNPYNGQRTHHVVDAKGHVVFSSNNPGEAKQHLARHYGNLFGEEKDVELDPAKREVGTDSLVALYKRQTPGQSLSKEEINQQFEDQLSEVSSELLDRYKTKAKQSADDLTAQGKHKQAGDRWLNVMKATGKQIEKTTANIKKALNTEETSNLKDACWDGYTAVGMKMKNGKKVPNCVPVKEEVDQLFTEATTRHHLSKVPVGKMYTVEFIWRGQTRKVQLFFPSMTRPTLEQIKKQIERTFPSSIVKRFDFITGTGNMPLLVVQEEADGKKLNKPFRTPGGPKKFAVYVKSEKGNTKKVTFGDPNMEIKRDDPDRRKAYRARHNCDNPGPKTKANYWSCRNWASSPVGK